MKKDYSELLGEVTRYPDIGCTARFRPCKRGASMVVELKVGGNWEAFLVGRLPWNIDDAIKRNRCKLYDAAQKMSPEELFELIPPSCPMTHQVRGCALIA
eukprot:1895661-Pyramimonas_sp.AAC.1